MRTDSDVDLQIGPEEIHISNRYQTLSIANDFLIAIWFLLGSVFFLFPALEKLAVYLFIVGSAQFLLRPALRLTQRVHIGPGAQSRWDM